MSISNITNTYTSNTTVSIPANSRNVRVTSASGRGGQGGEESFDNFRPGGAPGPGITGTFRYNIDFTSRSLTIVVGAVGANGAGNAKDSGGGAGGGGTVPGGRGGDAGGNSDAVSFSGAGAGGGSSSGVIGGGGNWQIISGGGGGGGGASRLDAGLAGGSAGGFSASVGGVSGGGAGATPPGSTDGAGGGGGGGGAPGGAGGPYGVDAGKGTPVGGGGGGVGGGSGYNSSIVTLQSSSSFSGNPFVSIVYELVTPEITAFSASPNPQTSGTDGVPRYSTSLTWTAKDFTTLTLTSSAGESWNVTGGSFNISNLPQSTVGSNSPATRSYTLTACAGGVCTSRSVTVSAFNDNIPRDFSIPNQNNVEPNSSIQISVGQILDIDMITTVTGGPGVQVSVNGTSWSSTIGISNGNNLSVRATSLGFNTDPNGLTNTATFYVDVGPLRRFFTITTRAPIVKETFNYPNYNDKVPFPDIDTIESGPEHPAKQFIETSSIVMDDIELANPYGVEIKSSNQNIQMRKRISGSAGYTDWVDTRNI
jgi:hypothetical protein